MGPLPATSKSYVPMRLITESGHWNGPLHVTRCRTGGLLLILYVLTNSSIRPAPPYCHNTHAPTAFCPDQAGVSDSAYHQTDAVHSFLSDNPSPLASRESSGGCTHCRCTSPPLHTQLSIIPCYITNA